MSASVNEVMDDKTLLKVYKREIDQLRERLAELEKEKVTPPLPPTLTPTAAAASVSPSASMRKLIANNSHAEDNDDDVDDDENQMILQVTLTYM
jgi:hypothetical protein